MYKKQMHHTKTTAQQHNDMFNQMITPPSPDQWNMAELHPANNKPQLGHEYGTSLDIPALGSEYLKGY